MFYNRQMLFQRRTTRTMLLDQHRAINAAVQARDPAAARAAVAAHLGYIQSDLAEWRRAARHEEVARLRIEHERDR